MYLKLHLKISARKSMEQEKENAKPLESTKTTIILNLSTNHCWCNESQKNLKIFTQNAIIPLQLICAIVSFLNDCNGSLYWLNLIYTTFMRSNGSLFTVCTAKETRRSEWSVYKTFKAFLMTWGKNHRF